jgi:hypothetical protein
VKFGDYITQTHLASDTWGKLVSMSTSDIVVPGMSLKAHGFLIGVVGWTSDPIRDGVIPQRGIEKLGWTQEERSLSAPSAPDQLCRTLVAGRGHNGKGVLTYYSRACLFCLLNETPHGQINTKELLDADDIKCQQSIVQDHLERVRAVTWKRVILQGRPYSAQSKSPVSASPVNGELVGLGPPRTLVQGVIAIFLECSVPVILRPYRRDPSLP